MDESEALRYLHRHYVGWLAMGQWEPERSLPRGTYPETGEWMRLEWRFSAALPDTRWQEAEEVVIRCMRGVGETWAYSRGGQVSAVIMANCLSAPAKRTALWVGATDAAEELQRLTGEPTACYCAPTCQQYQALMEAPCAELHAWWTEHCAMTPQERRTHRRKIQNYLKKGQYGHVSGYVARCIRREEHGDSLYWYWIPLVMESLWMQRRPPMTVLMEHLDFQGLERDGVEALTQWIRKTCAALSKSAEPEDPIARVTSTIRRDCSLPYSQTNLAEGLGLTPAYFSRLFEKRTGQRFTNFLTQARIARAQELLRDGATLAEVAAASGFQRKSYFCEVFRRQTGMTALQYRTHWKESDAR